MIQYSLPTSIPGSRNYPDKKEALHHSIQDALHTLARYPQWICFIFATKHKRITKPPINPNIDERRPIQERLANPTDPTTWATYETAAAAWRNSRTYRGIGFVFTATDPLCGVDLDHCRNAQTGEIAAWAKRILTHLNSYSEVSISGTGIHILLKAKLHTIQQVLDREALPHKKGRIEIYDEGRYFCWTGQHLSGTPTQIMERQNELTTLYAELFPLENRQPQSGTRTESTVLLPEDEKLIELARQARGGNGQKFRQLWEGDVSHYRKPGLDNEYDYSQADLALCSILAYWTNKDAARIDRLFRRSGLYTGERIAKWHRAARNGETYGAGTIRVAIARCHATYNPAWRPPGWIDYRQNQHSNGRKPSFPQNRK